MKIGNFEVTKQRMIPVAIFVLLIFFLWHGLSGNNQLPSAKLGHPIPQFSLPTLDNSGNFTPESMAGQIVLLNVWASWCATCKLEQNFLASLVKNGVHVYGLNYKDKPADALAWLKQWGNPYAMIGYDETGDVAIDLGVYGAPETFLLDKDGVIQYRYIGVLDQDAWDKIFLPRIKRLLATK